MLLLLLLSSALPGSISQPAKDWEGSPFLQDGETRYACAGESVAFDWRLNPEGSLVNVEKMQFQHQSEDDFQKFNLVNPDSIAVIDFPENEPERVLIPMDPKYAGRIEMNKSVMTINRLKVSDSGLYSEVVEGRDRTTGDKKTITSTITLVVADDVMTSDKELHISESVDAFFNETTGRHHKVLECGRFTYNTTPRFDVTWKVPGMSKAPSTEYRVDDGSFRLVLPLRMRTGSYGCSVTKQNAARACAKAPVNSSEIRLDAMETRFWLLGKDLARAQTMIKGNNATMYKLAANISELREMADDFCRYVPYKNDSNPARAMSNGFGSNCDKDLKGWYRFTLNGRSATIPTTCAPYNRCGTGATMWLDLQGGSLPAPWQEKTARACSNGIGGIGTNKCCYGPRVIKVRNCGSYYIYLLNGTPSYGDSKFAYCAQN